MTAEPSLPSTRPRLRPLPRWGSTMAFQLFPAQPPVSLTPLTPLRAALETDKELWKRIPGSYACCWGLAPQLPQELEEETTRRGHTSPSLGKLHPLVGKALPEVLFGSRSCARHKGSTGESATRCCLPVTKPCHSDHAWDKSMAPGGGGRGRHVEP